MDEAISRIQRAIGKGSVALKDVKEDLILLEREAELHGLSDEHLTVLLRLFDYKRSTQDIFLVKHVTVWTLALRCILPQQVLQRDHALKILKWISFAKNRSAPSVNLGLQLIAGLLKYGLVDEEVVSMFYHIFIEMMEERQFVVVLSWIIRKLTQPHDVTRPRTLLLVAIRRKFPKMKKYLDIVLWAYKVYKPEMVPESVSVYDVSSVLRLREPYTIHFERIRKELDAAAPEQSQLRKFEWVIAEGFSRKPSLIPGVDYMYVGMSHLREKRTSVLSIRDWKAMQRGQIHPNIPTQVMSLLQNPLGHHLIVCGNDALQHRLSYTLFETLHQVFIDGCTQVDVEEEKHLLKQICLLQEYMSQGIPAVGRFLGLYLMRWDGHRHFQEIMHLIERIVVSSVDELDGCVMRFVTFLYMCSNVETKCEILKHVLALFVNNAMTPVRSSVFLTPKVLARPELVVRYLIGYINRLCYKGLVAENCDSALLSCVLHVYRVMASVQEFSRVLYLAVIPPMVMYAALFSTSYNHLEIVAFLLKKYAFETIPKIDRAGRGTDFSKEKEWVTIYVNDFMNMLWHGKAFLTRRHSLVYNTTPREVLGNVRHLVKGFCTVFDARRHPSLSVVVKKRLSGVLKAEIPGGAFLCSVKRVCPSVWHLTCDLMHVASKELQKRKRKASESQELIRG